MTPRPMRKLPALSLSPRLLFSWRNPVPLTHRFLAIEDHPASLPNPPRRNLAQVRPEPLGELWFTSSTPSRSPADDILNHQGPAPFNDHKPPDERTLKLGKTLRTLSPLLPNILNTPLPTNILSPTVSLHLFPSTHPHLPTVKGRVPYRAALWTAPVAWGCVPLVGNTKIQIVSEKIVRTGFITTPQPNDASGLGEEKLVVRWKTEKRKNGQTTHEDAAQSTTINGNGGINRGLSALLGGDRPLFNGPNSEFTGIFIFSFDKDGRIATHTIEHADENNGFDRTSKVVTLADWLLGKARGRREEDGLVPGLAIVREEWARERRLRGKGERLW